MEALEAGDPRQVGRFEIVARLGAGGMGRVYLARSSSGEQFALKMIHQFLSDDVQFRRRFEREVMAARRVTGENTAALVDADPDARPPWMAVEFVDGPTLTELIEQGGPLTLSSCVRLASGMAAALTSIHAVGLVHRDLKPSNVLMGAGGARLIDFGIAQASGASSLTMTGLVTGSAGFMSPEQAQAEHVTEASDVFALGTVLYFAATGRKPFGEGSMISVTYRVVHGDPDLSGIRDPGLRELIADCLMKDPQLRPTPAEIHARCPGIADGTWSAGRSGDTVETYGVSPMPLDPMTIPAQGFAPAAYQQDGYSPDGYQQDSYQQDGYQQGGYPQPSQGYQQSGYPQYGYSQSGHSHAGQHSQAGHSQAGLSQAGLAQGYPHGQSRRDGRSSSQRSDGWRDYLRKPWLILPVAGAAVLVAGVALATSGVLSPNPTEPGSGTTPEPGETAGQAGPATPGRRQPGQNPLKPSIVVSTTGPAATDKPKPGATARPTSRATATKPGVVRPSATAAEPKPDPTVAPTKEPDVPVPPPPTTPAPDPTTASPTPSPTPASGGGGGGGAGGGGTGGGTGIGVGVGVEIG